MNRSLLSTPSYHSDLVRISGVREGRQGGDNRKMIAGAFVQICKFFTVNVSSPAHLMARIPGLRLLHWTTHWWTLILCRTFSCRQQINNNLTRPGELILVEDIFVNTKHDSWLGIFDVVTRLFLFHSLFLQQGRNMLINMIIKIIFLVSRYKYKHKKDAHLLLS